MAGDWMKIALDLPDKPEVFQIADCLNIDCDAVVGKLIRVWSWFDRHTEDGNAHGVTSSLVDRLSSVTGFADAMVSAGWLIDDQGRLEIPRFERHNGESAKKRALTAQRVAAFKARSNAFSNANGNAVGVTNALPKEEKNKREKRASLEPEQFKRTADLGVEFLTENGVPPDAARDWIATRARKKKPLTEMAWKAIKREANIAGISPADAVIKCAENGWLSFKAEWIQPRKGQSQEQPTGFYDPPTRNSNEILRDLGLERAT